MERRNRAIKALKRLQYIDSLEDEQRASLLKEWVEEYIINQDSKISFDDISYSQALVLSELYHKNIAFLKEHRVYIRETMNSLLKERKFLR